MNRLFCPDLWKTITKLSKRCNRKSAAIAYVSSDKHLRFGAGYTLVTDASDRAIQSGQTSAAVLKRAWTKGAAVYSLKGLHAKVMLFQNVAVIGSANVSESSHKLIEAAWATEEATSVAMASTLIEELADLGTEVDEAFIDRIMSIDVVRQPFRGSTEQDKKIRVSRIQPPQTWIVGTRELTRDFPNEEECIEKGEAKAASQLQRRNSTVDWIRFVGRSRFRQQVKRGDVLIQMWRPRGAKVPTLVYKPTHVLHPQQEHGCTRVFVETPAEAVEAAISWPKFRRLLKRVGLAKQIRPNSLRPISTEELREIENLWP